MSVLIEDALPVVKFNGLNTNKNVDFSGATTVALPAGTTIAGTTAAGTSTITSTSANALSVGRQGATNPVLNVNASAATVATGITIVGAAAASGVAIQVTTSGTNEDLTIDAAAAGVIKIGNAATTSGLITLGNATAVGGTSTFGPVTITSASANSFKVGRLGATTPAFHVDSSASTQVIGLKVTGAATGTAVAVAVVGATNESLTINAQGSGTIGIASASTGITVLNRGVLKTLIIGETLTAAGAAQNTTPTAAQLLGGVYTQISQTGAGTITLPTGTNLSNAVAGVTTGDSFEAIYANVGSQTVTITGDTGSTVIGTSAITTGKVALMRFICTGSNAWSVYCMMG